MTLSFEALQLFQLIVYLAVGTTAIVHWFRRRSTPAAWIAATFAELAGVVLVARFFPADPRTDPVDLWPFRLLLAALALFPFFLHKFHASLLPVKRWVDVAAGVLTGVTILFA